MNQQSVLLQRKRRTLGNWGGHRLRIAILCHLLFLSLCLYFISPLPTQFNSRFIRRFLGERKRTKCENNLIRSVCSLRVRVISLFSKSGDKRETWKHVLFACVCKSPWRNKYWLRMLYVYQIKRAKLIWHLFSNSNSSSRSDTNVCYIVNISQTDQIVTLSLEIPQIVMNSWLPCVSHFIWIKSAIICSVPPQKPRDTELI